MADSLNSKSGWGLMQVILASSVGTLIEWYDFYIYGTLAPIIAKQFFPPGNNTAAYLAALGTFAAGFVVRPFGALVFGRLGDLVGRKYTFLVTLVLMGLSTFVIGLIPGYASIGMAAPALILGLRLLQGLALGGEYGGAATYVAEHAPANRRGYYTGFIQTTATVGLLVSILVILGTKAWLGDAVFGEWGWRVPFWVSIFMVIISIYIRLKMQESPMFSEIKKAGNLSKNPLTESFGKRRNLKMVLLALFGAVAGQGVVWYTGQFYAMSFLDKVCFAEFNQVRYLLGAAILIATPFFLVFGGLSDRIGRKAVMMTGLLLAVLTYRPIYQAMYRITDISKKDVLTEKSARFTQLAIQPSTGDSTFTNTTVQAFVDGGTYKEIRSKTVPTGGDASKGKETVTKTYWMSNSQWMLMLFLVLIQIIYVTMVYGPIAAYLVELFPTRIRYSSMSLPYHIGNGIFGGLTPAIATRLVDAASASGHPDPFVGLWYPIGVAAICFLIGMLYMPARHEINDTV